MSNMHTQALIRASMFYLTRPLDEALLDGEEEVLDAFIVENAWEPFGYWEADDIYELIAELASSFEEFIAESSQ